MKDLFANHGTEIFAFINLIAVSIIIPMFKAWLDTHLTAKRAQIVENAVQAGLKAAIASATSGQSVGESIRNVINDQETRANVTSLAMDYVRETVPGALNKLGVDSALSSVVGARIDDAMAGLAQKYITANKAVAVSQVVEAGIDRQPDMIATIAAGA